MSVALFSSAMKLPQDSVKTGSKLNKPQGLVNTDDGKLNFLYIGTSITRASISQIFDNLKECLGPCLTIYMCYIC